MFLEPDVWIGKVNIDALGAMRGKQAEIHRGSRQRNIGPPQEAGYTSAIATSKPEPNRPLQLGGVHIHPHMPLGPSTVVSIALWHARVREMVALQLSEYR